MALQLTQLCEHSILPQMCFNLQEKRNSHLEHSPCSSFGLLVILLRMSSLETEVEDMPSNSPISLELGFPFCNILESRSRFGRRSEERRVGKECRSRWSP